MNFCIVLVIFIVKSISSSNEINPDFLVVNTTEGPIRGTQNFTIDAYKNYFKFSGIPFAIPPVGDLRFQPSIPALKRPEGHILNTTQDASQCVQGVLFFGLSGSEDCLYLNVYTPILPAVNKTEELLPVMVFIFGGFFYEGSNKYDLYGPDFFLDENVIVVTLNYRLGIFGFLSTEDMAAPGNNGLKDQLLAVKWVKNNIENFGGNSENVTIWGESAGSASVSYFLQSSLTKNLFQAAIMESGTSLCPWALSRQARKFAYYLGIILFRNTSTSKSLVDGLRKVNYVLLQSLTMILQFLFYIPNLGDRGLVMGPVIEPDHEDAFFTGLSFEKLNRGDFVQVPAIIGFNSLEADGVNFSFLLRIILSIYFTINSQALTPVDMNAMSGDVSRVANLVKRFYWGNNLPASTRKATARYASDEYFDRPIRETVRLHSKYATVFYYEFGYIGNLGSQENRPLPGASHAEELNYLFRRLDSFTPTGDDQNVRKTMVKMWANFAKCGSPTCSLDFQSDNLNWLSARNDESGDNLNYFLIDNSGLHVRQNPLPKIVEFWNDIYGAFGNLPYATY